LLSPEISSQWVERICFKFNTWVLPCPCQFINDLAEHESWAGTVVWLDFTKYGKVTGTDLNDCCDLVARILGKKPQKTVAVVIGPYLVSEKVQNNMRGEIRTALTKNMLNS